MNATEKLNEAYARAEKFMENPPKKNFSSSLRIIQSVIEHCDDATKEKIANDLTLWVDLFSNKKAI